MSDFLAGERAPEDYCHSVLEKGSDYNGFSLIAADLRLVMCMSNT